MIQCNTIAIHSSSFVRSAARSFVHAPSPSPSARARVSPRPPLDPNGRSVVAATMREVWRRSSQHARPRRAPANARARESPNDEHKNSQRRSASSSTSNRLARVASERIQHSFDRAHRSVVSRVDRTTRGERRARGEDTPRARRFASARKNTRRERERRVTRRVVIVTRGRFIETA